MNGKAILGIAMIGSGLGVMATSMRKNRYHHSGRRMRMMATNMMMNASGAAHKTGDALISVGRGINRIIG